MTDSLVNPIEEALTSLPTHIQGVRARLLEEEAAALGKLRGSALKTEKKLHAERVESTVRALATDAATHLIGAASLKTVRKVTMVGPPPARLLSPPPSNPGVSPLHGGNPNTTTRGGSGAGGSGALPATRVGRSSPPPSTSPSPSPSHPLHPLPEQHKTRSSTSFEALSTSIPSPRLTFILSSTAQPASAAQVAAAEAAAAGEGKSAEGALWESGTLEALIYSWITEEPSPKRPSSPPPPPHPPTSTTSTATVAFSAAAALFQAPPILLEVTAYLSSVNIELKSAVAVSVKGLHGTALTSPVVHKCNTEDSGFAVAEELFEVVSG